MAGIDTKIKLYLQANSKTWEDEQDNIIIQNDSDGKGTYLHTWSVDGLDKPTDSQLTSFDSAGDTFEKNAAIDTKRRTEYLSWREQLDKLWHDINDGKLDKTGSWYKHIKAVKDANSKE
jgi:hypothetical protein